MVGVTGLESYARVLSRLTRVDKWLCYGNFGYFRSILFEHN